MPSSGLLSAVSGGGSLGNRAPSLAGVPMGIGTPRMSEREGTRIAKILLSANVQHKMNSFYFVETTDKMSLPKSLNKLSIKVRFDPAITDLPC